MLLIKTYLNFHDHADLWSSKKNVNRKKYSQNIFVNKIIVITFQYRLTKNKNAMAKTAKKSAKKAKKPAKKAAKKKK